ncbi:MAG: tRNA pseudouridine(55) synthase TruB [Selenomonadaceae bacterium]|nr:tRNA pseudouridine(55) synthase TruB [Selenomonadaceae bacterium]
MTDGFINLNKPSGITSHDAVNRVRKILSTKKVGHAGTLDPAACGVLPIAVGRATKFIEYLTDCDKSYRAEILFSIATDSGDLEGEVIARTENFVMPTREEFEKVAAEFIGEIEQTPPKFSAIKINGQKAYDLARKNLSFDMPKRTIKISALRLLDLGNDSATIEVDCGKGTYIRSLAQDLGERLELPSTLRKLIRLRVGNFNLESAHVFEDITAEKLLPIENCLNHLPSFELNENRIRAFTNGLPTTVNLPDAKVLRIISGGKFLGVGRIEHGDLKSSKII